MTQNNKNISDKSVFLFDCCNLALDYYYISSLTNARQCNVFILLLGKTLSRRRQRETLPFNRTAELLEGSAYVACLQQDVSFVAQVDRKNPKNSDTPKICCNHRIS